MLPCLKGAVGEADRGILSLRLERIYHSASHCRYGAARASIRRPCKNSRYIHRANFFERDDGMRFYGGNISLHMSTLAMSPAMALMIAAGMV